MSALLLIMVVLAIHSVFLDGAEAGIRFYLIPDFDKMVRIGILAGESSAYRLDGSIDPVPGICIVLRAL